MQTVFEAAGGEDFFISLANAWHERVKSDEVVGHAFRHGVHPEHTKRLAAYWAEALGGPPSYSEHYGDESLVVRMHSGNGEHQDMDAKAIACFDGALDDVGVSTGELRTVLHDYFAWATAHSMAAYPDSARDVPAGLRIPTWGWDGLLSR
ncbi:oxidoreductase [Paenarthrobacter sp. NPDC089714]|uniref:globin domain-containing protein n=1 Tax=Paenarthrobacter sp. NPDC089714 TaxID=3364377 RepID=UPI0038271BE1